MVEFAEPAASQPSPGRRHRRFTVGAILALAVITGFVAIFSTWVRRQALDTSNWTSTSSKLLADPQIQDALGVYLVDELYANVDVAGDLRSALPSQASGLAGPAAGGLRELADRAAPRVLARPRVQAAWRQANTVAHRQLLRILDGGGSVASTGNGQVTLDLHALVGELAATLGVGQRAGGAAAKARGAAQRLGVTLPPSTGKLVILRSDQLATAQDVAHGIRTLSIVFTIVSLSLFALAVALASGWRRLALRSTGWCFFGLGVFTLLLRRVAGNWIVNDLVKSSSVRPAAHSAWSIGTSLLQAIAVAMAIYGLVIVTAAWLAGPTRPARALRRALAPSLRDRPAVVYGVATLLYLLLLLWGPTPALRSLVPILLIAALLVVGIELLRRQAAGEAPDAQAGDAMRRVRAALAARRRPPGEPGAPRNGAQVEQLERLAALHERGALTDDEYATEKALLLRPS
ncbi:MAG: SHOCT domain-containing protein [Thermoleophilaceae bacterium]|nr:SHOCT domain-containing protein [Thermoleophilaceae bacterium]